MTAPSTPPNGYPQSDADHWRRKYLASVKSLEQEERAFRSLESLLRRLLARLCLAAFGRSTKLDQALGPLAIALRNAAGEAELDKLFGPIAEAVAEAVAATDRRRAGTADIAETTTQPVLTEPPAEGLPGEERIRATLSRVLGLLGREGGLVDAVQATAERLQTPLAEEALPLMVSEVADLVARRLATLEGEKREVEELLGQVTGRLDELTRYLHGAVVDRREALQDSNEFNARLAQDFHELNQTVDEDSADLQQMRQRLRTRLDTMSGQVQEFRDREQARAEVYLARSDRMRAQVERLEGEARRLHDRLRDERRLASIDALTQVPNRMACDQRLAEELQRWQQDSKPVCIAVWDIDFFKRINDAYGHRAGDRVLRLVADTLSAGIRQEDFVARYGGEEFVMVLSGANAEQARSRADELRTAVSQLSLHFRGAPVSVTVSCGLTALREGDSLDEAFDRADKALYRAKDEGRNRCLVG